MPARRGRPKKGDRRIDACIDHFAFKGYAARDVRAVVADLLKVYGGPDAWMFLEEGCYKVVQERLLDIEDEEKQKKDQQLLLEHHQQQDGQQVEDEQPPQVPAAGVLQNMVAMVRTDVRLRLLVQWSGMPPALANWEDFFLDNTWEVLETLRQRFPQASPRWQAGHYQGVDVSSSTTKPPTSDSMEHDVSQAMPSDITQGTEAEHGPRRGSRVRRRSTRTHGPEWV